MSHFMVCFTRSAD